MYCPQCGSTNEDEARFCTKCGLDMDEYRKRWRQAGPGDTPQPGTTPEPAQEPVDQTDTGYQQPHTSYEQQSYGTDPGRPPYGPPPYQQPYQPAYRAMPHVPSYLGWAIATLILCFWPTGIVAVVYASQVTEKLARGDYEGAVHSSKRARLWSWITFAIAAASWVIGVLVAILMFAVAGASITTY